MNIEELAFKNYHELKDTQKVDLLLIIEFLQKDRKQWINQYTTAHNDYVNLQQENKQLKEQLEREIKVRDEIHNYLHNKIDKQKHILDELEEQCKECKHCMIYERLKELRGRENE